MTIEAGVPARLAGLSDEEKRKLLAQVLRQTRPAPVLSSAQERLWQLAQISPGDPAYNFQSAIRLTGPLQLPALQVALDALVARHEPLRTRYGAAQGKPQVELLAPPSVTVELEDWAGTAGDAERRLQAAATAAAQTRFALDRPPLFRLQCFRLAPEEHALVLTMHHIVSDLLSLDLFLEELGRGYGAVRTGRAPRSAPPRLAYGDHARIDQARRAALREGPDRAFWREHLQGLSDLTWRSDFPRPARPTRRAATTHIVLDAEAVERVTELARAERATPFAVLLAAYEVLQWAATGQSDQVVCVPTAGRERDGLEELIGMFSSPLPVRTSVSGDESARALLRRVRQAALAVTEHRSLPFADIVEAARSSQPAGAGSLPLRTMFSFVGRMKALEFPGLALQRVPTDRGVSDFDLFLTVYEDGGVWKGVFEYSLDLFGAQTAQAWASAYAAIVRGLTADPEAPVASLGALVPVPAPLRIAVSATFTADGVEEGVAFWQRELRWPIQLELAPYNQVFQALLDPGSALRREGTSLAVLLVRPEDWVRHAHEPEQRRARLAQAASELEAAVSSARLRAPLEVYLCPGTSGAADADLIAAAEQDIVARLSAMPGVTVRRAEEALARYGLRAVHDARAEDIGHVPFVRAWFAALSTELVRRATAAARRPHKVLAVDCDNTLWRGVCGEVGPEGVQVDGPYRALQEFVTRQLEEGMLLCLVSKNQPDDVFQVFERNPGMVLRRGQVVAHRINWEPKSQNLRALADELRLGLDSFVFLDDNPVECAEVRAGAPEVLTLCLPEDPARFPAFLEGTWAFDRRHVGAEDRLRAASIVQDRHRAELRLTQGSFAAFIASLELEVEVLPPGPDGIARLAQLSQRTNQFNNAGVRYDEAALLQALRDGLQAFLVSVRDRFGDYGIVGAVTHRVTPEALEAESFLLSCRVLGRGVEHRMLAELGRLAQSAGRGQVRISIRDLPRNQPFRAFVAGLPGVSRSPDGSSVELAAADAAAARFDPERGGAEAAAPSEAPTSGTASDVHVTRQAALAEVAGWLGDADGVLARMDQGRRKTRSGAGGSPPQGATEVAIAEVWQDALRLDRVMRDDNFFEVGGNSLLLVEVNGRLIERLNRAIEITTLFQFPTVASLATHLSGAAGGAEANARILTRGENARRQMQRRMQQLGDARRR